MRIIRKRIPKPKTGLKETLHTKTGVAGNVVPGAIATTTSGGVAKHITLSRTHPPSLCILNTFNTPSIKEHSLEQ